MDLQPLVSVPEYNNLIITLQKKALLNVTTFNIYFIHCSLWLLYLLVYLRAYYAHQLSQQKSILDCRDNLTLLCMRNKHSIKANDTAYVHS